MSIYQTRFCFICTHLTSGEKDSDELKRNADVCEIHRRTRFYHDDGFPQNIHGHEYAFKTCINFLVNILIYDAVEEHPLISYSSPSCIYKISSFHSIIDVRFVLQLLFFIKYLHYVVTAVVK